MFPLAVMSPINLWVSVEASPNIVEPSVKTTDDVTKEDVIDVAVIEPCMFKLPLALMSP